MNQDIKKKIEELIPIKLRKQNYNKHDVLALSVKLTNEYEFSKAFKMRNIAEKIYINENCIDTTFILLEESVITHIFQNKVKYDHEYSLYEPIKYYINELIENSKVIDNKIINNKRPDLFLSVNNQLCVGEIKPGNFTEANINQLRMYILTYKTKIGYAFGLNLKGILDKNMIFIDISNIKERFYKFNNTNKTFNIENYGTFENPLFKATEIGKNLNITNIRELIRNYSEELKKYINLKDSNGRNKVYNMLTPSGLYKILLTSQNYLAREFQRWVCNIIKEGKAIEINN